MTWRPRWNALQRLRADERGAVSTEYVVITSLSLILALAIGTSVVAIQQARERSDELMHVNVP